MSLAHRQFRNIVPGVYKPVPAKHSRSLPVQDSLAIVAASDFARYKDGTRCNRALVFLKGSYGTCRATAARYCCGDVPARDRRFLVRYCCKSG
jgi:hypothetical protein